FIRATAGTDSNGRQQYLRDYRSAGGARPRTAPRAVDLTPHTQNLARRGARHRNIALACRNCPGAHLRYADCGGAGGLRRSTVLWASGRTAPGGHAQQGGKLFRLAAATALASPGCLCSGRRALLAALA